MSTAPFRRHAPGAGAGPDPRTPPPSTHLALVTATPSSAECALTPRTAQEAFCARLRASRERRGISLRTLAETTKVTTTLFEALERGDVSRWPKGIYKRSFFRGYAAAIGLPTDSATEEFLRLFPDEKAADPQPEETGELPAPLRLTLAPDASRVPLPARISLTTAIDALVVFVVALALAWWSGVGWTIGASFVALCYYPQAARVVRSRTSRKPNRGGAANGSPEACEGDAEELPVT